jgi:hypothetical protein
MTSAVQAESGDAVVVGSTEELFQLLRQEQSQGYAGDSIDEILALHLSGRGEIDEGTYPPSDLWESMFDSRRDLPTRLTYSGRGVAKFSEDEVSGVRKWEKELELSGRYADWSAYLRLTDVNSFSYNNDPFRLKKYRLRYSADTWRVSIGSVGGVFGRGLAINMFEDRFLEFDNETEGIRADISMGKSDLTTIIGRRKKISDERHSSVSAIRYHTSLSDQLELGMHYAEVSSPAAGGVVVVSNTSSNPVNMDSLELYGADITVRTGDFSFFAEKVHVKRPEQPWANEFYQIEGEDGSGLYLNAALSGKGYAVVGEYKAYRLMNQPFAVPPAVRRWQEKSTSYPDDDKGYNFSLFLTPGQAAGTWQFSYGQDNKRGGGRPYSEALASYASHASSGGFSYVAEVSSIFDEIEVIEMGKLSLSQVLNEEWNSSAVLQRKRHNSSFADSYTYDLWSAEVSYQSEVGLVFTRERSSQEVAAQRVWQLWEMKYKPSSDQELSLVHGKRREGYVCSGGICRLEPAFAGTKVEYSFRF